MDKQITEPSDSDGKRCIEMRKLSKRGIGIGNESHKFNLEMLKKHEEWYKLTESIVFNQTVPYGSGARVEVDDRVKRWE